MLIAIITFELSSGQTNQQTHKQTHQDTNATENITSPTSSVEVKRRRNQNHIFTEKNHRSERKIMEVFNLLILHARNTSVRMAWSLRGS